MVKQLQAADLIPGFGNELSADLFKFDAGSSAAWENIDRPQIASRFQGSDQPRGALVLCDDLRQSGEVQKFYRVAQPEGHLFGFNRRKSCLPAHPLPRYS